MSRIILVLILALIALGILISTVWNMTGDVHNLRNQNQALQQQLRTVQEWTSQVTQQRDTLKAQNDTLLLQNTQCVQAYIVEHQARLNAEAALATLQTGSIPQGQVQASNGSVGDESAELSMRQSGMIPLGSLSIGLLVGVIMARFPMRVWPKMQRGQDLSRSS